MSTESTTVEAQEVKPEVTIFDDLLSKTGLPPVALAPMKAKIVDAYELITENNRRIIQVNASTAKTKNDHDYLDSLWAAHVSDDAEIAAIEPLYQAAVEEYMKLQAQLRKLAEKHIPEVLSEEKAKEMRRLVGAGSDAIAKAKQSAVDMALVIDQMLELNQAKPEGGILSLLPEVDSLKNARGRKASTATGGGKIYMTRVGDILVDGKSTNIEENGVSKGKFNYAANSLNEKWNADEFPANAVTAIQLEEAFFKSMDMEFRQVTGKEIPESHSFDFTHDVHSKSKQDGTDTVESVTVKIVVKKAETAKAETPAADTDKPESKPEAPKAETPKAETLKPGDFIRPEPAKTENKAPAKKATEAPTQTQKK